LGRGGERQQERGCLAALARGSRTVRGSRRSAAWRAQRRAVRPIAAGAGKRLIEAAERPAEWVIGAIGAAGLPTLAAAGRGAIVALAMGSPVCAGGLFKARGSLGCDRAAGRSERNALFKP
jgi:1-deoxy-D-xylulose 5-phosphate reductoisomerase